MIQLSRGFTPLALPSRVPSTQRVGNTPHIELRLWRKFDELAQQVSNYEHPDLQKIVSALRRQGINPYYINVRWQKIKPTTSSPPSPESRVLLDRLRDVNLPEAERQKLSDDYFSLILQKKGFDPIPSTQESEPDLEDWYPKKQAGISSIIFKKEHNLKSWPPIKEKDSK
ncbi:MAG: hypothetical protein HEQ32_00635 [Vampirovibrio sp.]